MRAIELKSTKFLSKLDYPFCVDNLCGYVQKTTELESRYIGRNILSRKTRLNLFVDQYCNLRQSSENFALNFAPNNIASEICYNTLKISFV